jgi:proteasome lid subunit RPN8/RPN11
VPRRLDVDETLPPVAVPRPIVQELMLHAREADPDECCGLIVGDEGERYRRTVRCTNAMTQMHKKDPTNYPRDARQAFFIDPREWLEIHKQAEKDGERVTAVYHSHVGVGAYLSEEDLAYAETSPFDDADQIVIAVADRRVGGLALFRWDAERCEFTGHPVETAES